MMNECYLGMGNKSKAEALYLQKEGKEEKGEKSYKKTVAIFNRDENFGKVPNNLSFDPTITLQAKGLYAIYHGRSKEKILKVGSFTFMSQKRIAKENAGKSAAYICQLTKELENTGWLTTIRRGLGKTNIIILHSHQGEKITKEERAKYKIIVNKTV